MSGLGNPCLPLGTLGTTEHYIRSEHFLFAYCVTCCPTYEQFSWASLSLELQSI